MPTTDPRVDAYIEKSKDFAKPILTHIRALVHATCPEATETLKWSMPSFEYKGILCGFAAFKEHCTFGFWKQTLMESDAFSETKTAMGSFGKLKSLKDLPSDAVMKKLIKQAMKLNDDGVKVTKPKHEKKEVVIPEILLEALAKNEKAAETYNNFPPSCRREYAEWIAEAKTEPTREKRLAQTIEWLSEGKRRNWKYEKC
ncbi:MAG: YdeI/OmpD-associated family protein [Pyrinomonadaceae bacterium]|nr:YdeI/OmpD-associated family protein [Pyrinomonadaceae bacterium]